MNSRNQQNRTDKPKFNKATIWFLENSKTDTRLARPINRTRQKTAPGTSRRDRPGPGLCRPDALGDGRLPFLTRATGSEGVRSAAAHGARGHGHGAAGPGAGARTPGGSGRSSRGQREEEGTHEGRVWQGFEGRGAPPAGKGESRGTERARRGHP